jgi:hypothetical protein
MSVRQAIWHIGQEVQIGYVANNNMPKDNGIRGFVSNEELDESHSQRYSEIVRHGGHGISPGSMSVIQHPKARLKSHLVLSTERETSILRNTLGPIALSLERLSFGSIAFKRAYPDPQEHAPLGRVGRYYYSCQSFCDNTG